jgi:2,5-furandicarboxylate decarboxylase 1
MGESERAASAVVDLRGVLDRAEEEGELLHVRREVDPHLGIPSVMKAAGRLPRMPILLFENIAGYPGRRAAGGVLGHNDRVQQYLGFSPDPVRSKVEFLEAMQRPIPPVRVASGPVKENVVRGAVDVAAHIPPTQGALGVPRLYYQPVVITRHPRTGEVNAGIYRACVQSPGRITVNARWDQHGGLHIAAARDLGEPIEVAMVIGVDLADYLAGATKMPVGYDEFSFAGALRGRPTPLVRCETVDLWVPAHAEIVIEGVIRPPYELGDDGPWPEYLNYLGGEVHPPIVDVTALTFRDHPINQISIAGTIPDIVSFGNQAEFYRHVKAFAGDFVVDTNLASHSGGHHGIIKVRKTHPDQEGVQVNVALAAFGFVNRMDQVTVVDEDVDIYDYAELDWAVITRCNPTHQVHLLGEGRSHQNNPIAGVRKLDGEPIARGKMIVDATIPWRYRERRKPGGIGYFSLSEWPHADLADYLEPDDLARWTGRRPAAHQSKSVVR